MGELAEIVLDSFNIILVITILFNSSLFNIILFNTILVNIILKTLLTVAKQRNVGKNQESFPTHFSEEGREPD